MAEAVCCDSICLRVLDFSETSQVVTLLTASHGVIRLIAKGIRRIPKKTFSPLMAPLDVLAAGQVVFIPARQDGQLATLTAWDVTDHRPLIRRDYKKIIVTQLLAEVTTAAGATDDATGEMLLELERTIRDLAAADSLRPVVAYLKYAASAAGYGLDMLRCAECKKSLGLHASLQRRSVGLFCDGCCRGESLIRVDRRILSALHRLPSPCNLPVPADQAPADPVALFQAAQLLLFHLRAVLDERLRLITPFQLTYCPPSEWSAAVS
jgi:DNA repair protein RecO (recombination protein O)